MHQPRGMTLIDVVVGTAVMLIVFLSLLGILRVSATLSSYVKAQTTATTLANNEMEYIRSLSYDSVGTVGGIPAGPIPQTTTITKDGLDYTVRTFIAYYDDPADGTGVADANGITTDYKRIKVSVSFVANNKPREISLVSNYTPQGLETTTNGGTLQILIANALGAGVAGASVHIVNTSTSPNVDLTTFSDSTGTVYLPGAATSTEYQITVSKAGYSTAKTYTRDSTNQNPTPGYLTVAKNQTTSSTFAIDVLGTLILHTLQASTVSTVFSDSFTDAAKLTDLTNTVVAAGTLQLSGGAGSYSSAGTATSIAAAPTNLSSWGMFFATTTLPVGTSVTYHITDGSGVLVPDSALPGNIAGFIAPSVDLSTISTSTYPSLGVLVDMNSTDPAATPEINAWSITARQESVPIPDVSFTLTGSKTIGSTGVGAPIYKTIVTSSTDSSGQKTLPLEWDSYDLDISGYDVIDACYAPPFALSPGATISAALTLGAPTSNSLLVSVTDSTGAIVPGATVTLSRAGYTKTKTASSCGTAYFGNLTSASDYRIDLSKSGYTSTIVSNVSVTSHVFYTASF